MGINFIGENKLVRRLALVLLLSTGLLGGAVVWWLDKPMTLVTDPVDLAVASGANARQIADQLARAGALVWPDMVYAWFRLSGQSRSIKAGSYEITAGTTPRTLLDKLVRGEQALRSVTLVEGWTFQQVRAALSAAPDLTADTAGMTDAALMAKLGRPGIHPEGRFFPDTYTYPKRSSDLQVLERAMTGMDRQLQAVWQRRAADSPLTSPDQALVLGSIVEKETGLASDRPFIAGVFVNRLRIGMRLQTDPTVIYGLGAQFDGNLRKRDLQTDTPWNTYTRAGLPPTPISMPGREALLAAVAPAQTTALYFVARGDGSSQFSNTLAEHNRAVNTYQRNQRSNGN